MFSEGYLHNGEPGLEDAACCRCFVRRGAGAGGFALAVSSTPVRRGSIVQLVLISLVAAGIATALALIPGWLPVEASEEAGRINFVFWFVTAICIAIFALVAAVTIYAVLKFRVREDDDSDGPPIHGHTGLEIAWTAVPAVLVTAIGIVSAVVLARNSDAGPNPLRVDVLAQQFAWSFTYPGENEITDGRLRLPVGRTAELHFQARDVIHSFWVPQFGQKQDTVPGLETTLVITPKKTGTFPVVCTELCGLGHAAMRTQVVVMPQAEFDAWVRERGRGAADRDPGLAAFESNGCGSCHTLAAAKATGKSGPDLDELPEQARRAGRPLEEFVRESIVEPNAYVEPRFTRGVMPDTYDSLPDEQLNALVKFLVDSSRKAG
jgi:cytochrome c oxidase subunit II